METKRLGEVLRERNQVSADDLNRASQDPQGKLVHFGELLLERGIVSKDNLISAPSSPKFVALLAPPPAAAPQPAPKPAALHPKSFAASVESPNSVASRRRSVLDESRARRAANFVAPILEMPD